MLDETSFNINSFDRITDVTDAFEGILYSSEQMVEEGVIVGGYFDAVPIKCYRTIDPYEKPRWVYGYRLAQVKVEIGEQTRTWTREEIEQTAHGQQALYLAEECEFAAGLEGGE